MEPLPPDHGHNPKILRSWARRTGYKSYVSGEGGYSSSSDVDAKNPEAVIMNSQNSSERTRLRNPLPQVNGPKENHNRRTAEFIAIPPPPPPAVLASTDKKAPRVYQPLGLQQVNGENVKGRKPPDGLQHINGENVKGRKPPDGLQHINGENVKGQRTPEMAILTQSQEAEDVLLAKQSNMKFEIRENPGIVPSILYGLQQYLSMAGSIVLMPLVMVPAMGGSDADTAHVVSTVLMVTGLATLMHTFFGSRLPLIQGASFVYLAPALAIVNSTEFQRIGTNRFEHTMRELQGAVIVASAFHAFLGYSGLMSFLLRFVNPVVVTPTVASVGLAFFSYGFPVIGSCVEIGIPQMLVVLIFALYLRRVSIYGHRIFQVFAVPLGLTIVWAYAFLLTAGGAYNYSGCNFHVPVSNIISKSCRRHVFTMLHCRTDTSSAFATAAWLRLPYPFQWGLPTFQWKTASVMIVAAVISAIDSVGSYHASSLLVAARAPTPGVVSRATGLEGLTSMLAGLWGIGTGATTLTENVHTIAVTKMGSRRAIQFGACILVVMSVFGKIGAFIASIPPVMVASLLSIMWTMVTALGLSNLRYSETGSSRNVIIVGLSLFLSLTIPAYFQHYGSGSKSGTVASYFQPYTVASHGPIRTGFLGLDFFLNTTLSMNMAIAFLVAFLLDNTVPGSRQERGTYIWSKPSTARNDSAAVKDYALPSRLAKFFSWVRWVGL